MEIWIATTNQGKLREIEKFLKPLNFEVHDLKEIPAYVPPEENGKTFEANARIKAKSLAAVKNNVWILADDSGLEVDGIGGLPGVHTARYAGPNASDAENNAKLLKMVELRTHTNRKARFKSVIVVVSPQKEESVFDGSLEGQIATKLTGTQGFGYDPLFIPDGSTKSLGEFDLAEKNKLSHRAKALEKFAEYLKTKL